MSNINFINFSREEEKMKKDERFISPKEESSTSFSEGDLTKEEIERDYQQLVNQLNTIQQELAVLGSQEAEFDRAIALLNFILREGKTPLREKEIIEESLVPIALGVYAKAAQLDVRELFVSVGENIFVKKSPKATLELLKQRKKEIKQYKERLKDLYNEGVIQIEELERILREQNV